MQCSLFREAISARLDGEPLGMPSSELDAHLGACPSCRTWAADAELVTRRARLAAAPPVPDLTASVLGALPRELPGAAAAARARLVDTALRLALLAVGIAQATMAWPVLASGTGAMSAPVHLAHETGAWNLAVAAAFLAVAAAPRLAAGALPFLGSFAALLVPVTVADLGAGHVHAERAVTHLLVLAGVILVSSVAWRGRRRRAVRALGWPPGGRVRRARVLLVALLAAWFAAGVVTAGPAAAHATLVSTDPGEGARLESVPAEVTLEFSEGVSLGAGYARVLASDGARVDTGEAAVEGGVLTIPLRGDLPDDGYLVTYRVVSADSHPISGAYSFTVGDAELVTAGEEDGVDPVVAAALPAARWLGFAGLALAVGVPVLALTSWPAGWASPRLRRLAMGGAAAVAAGAVLTFLLQGPYTAATGVGSVLDPSLVSATASSAAGRTLLARAVLAVGLALVLLPVWRRGTPPSVPRVAVAGALAVGVVVGTAAIGHPVAGPWPGLAVAVAVVHAAGMAVWIGGLTGLLAVVLRRETPAQELAAALIPWSRIAFGAVAALAVSGSVQAVREVESPAALFVTTYGWLLVAKLLLVGVLLAAAGVSRVWVQQRLGVRRPRPGGSRSLTAHAFAAGSTDDAIVDEIAGAAALRGRLQLEDAAEHLPALRRSVLVEVAVAAVVLALSAVLVGTPPARSAVAQPVDVVLPLEGSAGPSGSVQLSVDPARPGPNTLHVYLFDDAGRLTQPAEIAVSLTESSQDIGPLDVRLEPAGPGHYVGDGMDIPGAGTWTLAVTVRLDEFTAYTARTDFPVR